MKSQSWSGTTCSGSMQLGCGSTVIRHPRQTVGGDCKVFLSACDKKDVQMWRPILGYFKESYCTGAVEASPHFTWQPVGSRLAAGRGVGRRLCLLWVADGLV